jgi:DNA helicase-2/ATP-dependent DNA helicase PcrA
MGAVDAFQKLNDRQREAAHSPAHPLLIIAGAGTGKTNTLAHRVVHLVLIGAALEMTRRANRIVAEAHKSVRLPWSGMFHCAAVGLTECFSVLDLKRRVPKADLKQLKFEVA